jgi:Family of unknown function (DUF6206)
MAVAATTSPPALDLEALDAVVEQAIGAGKADGLRVLGYGEFTLVLGWPTERPQVAVKRLPLFRDHRQFERYGRIVREYLAKLEKRGVPVIATELHAAPVRHGEGLHAYFVQPLAPAGGMLNYVLREAEPAYAARLFASLVSLVVDTVDRHVGLDAQAANWLVEDDTLTTVDISTPLLRDAAGRDRLDLDLFLSIYPWAVRPALARVAHPVMSQYHDPRTVLVDVASNLIKERHERWIGALLEASNAHVDPAITEREVRRYFVRDRRFWLLMQWLRRADRAWYRQVRRRTYPFLLPPPYHYGPPEIPDPRSHP